MKEIILITSLGIIFYFSVINYKLNKKIDKLREEFENVCRLGILQMEQVKLLSEALANKNEKITF